MDFQTAVRTCLSKYAVFEGRARRSEFWWFFVFNLVAHAAAGIIDGLLFGGMGRAQPVGSVLSLALFLPGLGVSVRRLHDTGRSGWWILLSFFPVIGGIILIWWFASEGTAGPNAYGGAEDATTTAGPTSPTSIPKVPRQ